MNKLDSFTVIATDASTATLTVEWVSSTNPKLKMIQNHRIPLEAEEDNWTKEELQEYFAKDLAVPAPIPAWAVEEASAEIIARFKKQTEQI